MANVAETLNHAGRLAGDISDDGKWPERVDAIGDLLAASHAVLGWVRHWTADLDAGLRPTPSSLATVEAVLISAIAKAEGRP